MNWMNASQLLENSLFIGTWVRWFRFYNWVHEPHLLYLTHPCNWKLVHQQHLLHVLYFLWLLEISTWISSPNFSTIRNHLMLRSEWPSTLSSSLGQLDQQIHGLTDWTSLKQMTTLSPPSWSFECYLSNHISFGPIQGRRNTLRPKQLANSFGSAHKIHRHPLEQLPWRMLSHPSYVGNWNRACNVSYKTGLTMECSPNWVCL